MYTTTFTKALEEPEVFWKEAAKSISWDKPFTTVLDSTRAPLYRWFPDGKLNMCYNCLDRHVLAGKGHDWSLIYDSPMTNHIIHYTYEELLDEVQKLAGAMIFKHNIKKGDRVIIYMPLVPEAIVAMLACARIGAVHSVVFGGFSAKELSNRIVDSQAKLIVTANAGLEPNKKIPFLPIVNEATNLAEQRYPGAENIPRIILNRFLNVPYELKPHRDHDFYEELTNSKPFTSVVSVPSTHPLYVLYTSGTTGAPKGVARDTGGYAVALDNAMKWVYGVNRGDTFWAASDVGWVVGHTCMVYGPLLRGATSVIYEGKPVGTPDAGAWWRLIQEHEVKSLFVAPTGIRAIKKEDPMGKLMKKYNLNTVEHFGVAGERCDPDTVNWLQHHLPKHTLINDHWWQTESGWPMISNFMGLEKFSTKPGSATKPVPGWDMRIIKEDLTEAPDGGEGRICAKLPTPPGFMLSLWENDEAFIKKYMTDVPGYYMSGDEGFRDEDGYFHIMGRIDDVINIAGHRFSTGAYEECIGFHPNVAECAVIGVFDEIKGEIPIAFIVQKIGSDITVDDLTHQIIQKVRHDIGAVASLKTCVIVKRLPKTRSGKIPRVVLKKIANGDEFEPPATLENYDVLDEIKEALETHGYPRTDYNLKE